MFDALMLKTPDLQGLRTAVSVPKPPGEGTNCRAKGMGVVDRELDMGCSSLLPALPWEWKWKVGAGAESSQELLAWLCCAAEGRSHLLPHPDSHGSLLL